MKRIRLHRFPSLLYDVFSILTWNDRMIHELVWIWKKTVTVQSRYYPHIYVDEVWKIMKNLHQDSQCPHRDLSLDLRKNSHLSSTASCLSII